MGARDWFEASWHAALLLLVLPFVLGFLQRHWWARAGLAAIIILALGYHVAVVTDCHNYLTGHGAGNLCRWNL